MKKGLLAFALCASALITHAQDHFVGASLNNNYLIYEDPIGGAYHYGLLLNAEKGLTFNNDWRFGIEAGFSQSVPIQVVEINQTITAPLTTSSYLPVRLTIGWHGHENYRAINPYVQLGVGYAFGATKTTTGESAMLVGTSVIILPSTVSSQQWGGFSGTFRGGITWGLSKTTFLNFGVGYHGLSQTVNSASIETAGVTQDIDVSDYESTFIHGAQLEIGIQIRFITAH